MEWPCGHKNDGPRIRQILFDGLGTIVSCFDCYCCTRINVDTNTHTSCQLSRWCEADSCWWKLHTNCSRCIVCSIENDRNNRNKIQCWKSTYHTVSSVPYQSTSPYSLNVLCVACLMWADKGQNERNGSTALNQWQASYSVLPWVNTIKFCWKKAARTEWLKAW